MIYRTEDERLALAEACRSSFWLFLRYAFGLAENAKMRRWMYAPMHKPLCDWLQWHGEEWLARRAAGVEGQTHLIVLVPRNFGKTTIVTRAFNLWLHLREPDLSTYIGSENLDRAIKFFKPLRSVIDGSDPYSLFTWLYGDWYNRDRPWATDQLVHAARKAVSRTDPSMAVWGVESGLTGAHPDVLILDDPTSYDKMAASSNWLNIVNDHIDSLLPVLNPDGMLLMVGTRYHDGDHMGRAIRDDGVRAVEGMRIPGVDARDDGLWEVFFLAARDRAGNPTFPKVWSDERLKRYERQNNAHYWAQMMNEPSESEHNPLTRAKIEKLYCPPEEVPQTLRLTLHMDCAFHKPDHQRRGDESVIQVWGHERSGSGEVWYLEGRGANNWREEDFLKQVVFMVQRYKARGQRIMLLTDEQETGGHEGAWENRLRSAFAEANLVMPRLVILKRGITQKVRRHIHAASFWAEGFVHLPKGAPGLEALVEQMSRIGGSRHDDWADCAADVFAEEVYVPMRRTEKDVQPERVLLPGDNVLRPMLTDQQAIALYDSYHGDLGSPYEPIQ